MPVAILDEVRTKGVLGVLSERFPAIASARTRISGGGGAGLGFGFLSRGGTRTQLPMFPGLEMPGEKVRSFGIEEEIKSF